MNAVILAAGLATRFAPLSYEKPKGLVKVRGEVLIERQIRMLHEAGINDITVVVGYMKEKFYYLKDMFGVRICVNEDYFRFNNTSSLMCVLDRLEDTFVCCSDNYFTRNVFLDEADGAYYSVVYSAGRTDEWCVSLDGDGVITSVSMTGGRASWYMAGHVFFSKEFSARFREILKSEYSHDEVRMNLWEYLYSRHLDTLVMKGRKYDASDILEFDTVQDLLRFDAGCLKDAKSVIMDNICRVLDCEVGNITDMSPILHGLTNRSMSFCVEKNGTRERYVYRHPGIGTGEYISRAGEMFSMDVAVRLGLDRTFICMDPEGWKISHYVEGVRTLDYHNGTDVLKALTMIRSLHDERIRSDHDFHIWQKTLDMIGMTRDKERAGVPGLSAFDGSARLHTVIEKLYLYTKKDGVEECLCHCDFYAPNILVGKDGSMNLIDWEYSGNDDPASDIGTFICCSDYTPDQAARVIGLYLGHSPTPARMRHFMAYVAIASYYWFVWAVYQSQIGNDVGEYLDIWYRGAWSYGNYSLELYTH